MYVSEGFQVSISSTTSNSNSTQFSLANNQAPNQVSQSGKPI